jgi:hypothetical protein
MPSSELTVAGLFTFPRKSAYYRLDPKSGIRLGFICAIVEVRLIFETA